jgi:DNA-binding response OmpR family regulator
MTPLNILVVEDYDLLRNVMVQMLRQHGYRVEGVPTAEDVADEPIDFVPDIYVIDLNLPGEDGIHLAQRLRQNQPLAGIVIASARISAEERVQGYQSGADVYLPKPLVLDELLAVLESLAGKLRRTVAAQHDVLVLDSLQMKISGVAGESHITQSEKLLLSAFARAQGQTLEHWQISQHLSPGKDISKENLEVRIGRLRKKISACGFAPNTLRALRGHGYKLTCRIEVIGS